MRVHFIDVGQGDASLIEFPCAAVLIDTGGESNDDFDSSIELFSYLGQFFSRRTDLNNRLSSLILTHPHKDHTLWVPEVLERYQPKNIVTNGQEKGSGKDGQIAAHEYSYGPDRTKDTADDIPFNLITIDELPDSAGLTNKIIDPINCGEIDPVITILWGQVMTKGREWNKKEFNDPNNHSLAIRIDFGKATILWTGDMEKQSLDDLVTRYTKTEVLDIDVYQVSHHGSKHDTTEDFLLAMTPEIAVISMGPSNRKSSFTAWQHGHPRERVVNLLNRYVQGERKNTRWFPVAYGQKAFKSMKIKKAIYATGWDGDVVLEATNEGLWSVIESTN